jgi:hypothetical protein
MNRKFFALLGLGLIIGACVAMWLSYQSILLSGLCVPIEFPNGRRHLGNQEYLIHEGLDEVARFFSLELGAVSEDFKEESNGVWFRFTKSEKELLFECTDVLGSGMTTETGCIYLHQELKGVRVTSFSFRSGGGTPCPRSRSQ